MATKIIRKRSPTTANGRLTLNINNEQISIKKPLLFRSWYKVEVKISENVIVEIDPSLSSHTTPLYFSKKV